MLQWKIASYTFAGECLSYSTAAEVIVVDEL